MFKNGFESADETSESLFLFDLIMNRCSHDARSDVTVPAGKSMHSDYSNNFRKL